MRQNLRVLSSGPKARMRIFYPGLLEGNSSRISKLRKATVENSEWITDSGLNLNHHFKSQLRADSGTLLAHAQKILDVYGRSKTRDVEIYLIPCVPDCNTDNWNGAYGKWQHVGLRYDEIFLNWASIDLNPLIRICTHELGHHLRAFEKDKAIRDRFRLTSRILHEMSAESLVLDIHGLQFLHHRNTINDELRSELFFLLSIEYSGQNPSEIEDHRINEICESNLLYPVATEFMLRMNIKPEKLFKIPIHKFLEKILPISRELKESQYKYWTDM